ncbi:MAG: methyltransferase domain-containing protein [Marmoricola sp.]
MDQPERPELAEIFTGIYGDDTWDGGSGPGSFVENIRPYLDYVQTFLDARGITSVVDCGCGDWQSTRLLDFSGISYTGYDIVASVVEANQATYGADNIEFRCADFSVTDLPPADLLICKDVLQHLPDGAVLDFLPQLSKYKYVLLTNDLGPNADRDQTLAGGPYHFAPIDLTQPPFAVPGRQVLQILETKTTLLVERPEPLPEPAPRITLAILAKQKEAVLPLYLDCIEALDYPKSAISLYVRTNNNTDGTAGLLRTWLDRVGPSYEHVVYDDADVTDEVQQFDVHEWNAVRFKVLAGIRQKSLQHATERGSDFYFTVDVDNFVRPGVLRELVRLDLPFVSPLLRHVDPANAYSNYHFRADDNGYYLECPEYYSLLHQQVRGTCEVDVAHCTYLLRTSVLPLLSYADGTDRHEYVVFSDSARRNGVPQYLDNRQIYGYLTLDEDPTAAERMLRPQLRAVLG